MSNEDLTQQFEADSPQQVNEIDNVNSLSTYVIQLQSLEDEVKIMEENLKRKKEAADKIYDFTHKLENDFKGPIARVVGLFTKDDKVKDTVTDGLFALLLLGLGAKAGTEAFSAIKNSNVVAGSISSLKAALKGKDIAGLIKNMIA